MAEGETDCGLDEHPDPLDALDGSLPLEQWLAASHEAFAG